ncbi:MAG: helix-turn-helix transcriptional regulator [Actinobacteria bacterium]|nr:helix-turn-helix transcriptional regulator [Actinomycetota bacterium]
MVGDRWTLLVLRDLVNGIRRFDDLARHLGVARDLLARRLTRLVEAGVVERRPYQEPGRRTRYEYGVTAAGLEPRPVLIALAQWGDRYLSGPAGPPTEIRHDGCGATVHLAVECTAGHRIEDGAELRMVALPAARRIVPAS